MADRQDGECIIDIRSLRKSYGSGAQATAAVNELDLRVVRGEFVSLMGPSGSGKSTLLNLIAGLDAPDSGRVLIDGEDLARLADHQLADMRLRKIGFVFQAFNLVPALNVGENVAWPLEFGGCTRSEVSRRVGHALAKVGMTGRERRFPAQMSGGEQQRVAIARAIATSPILLLADEPTGNLDSATGRLILDLLRSLNKDDGMTVVMVTHNVFAATYGDRTLEMRDGRIVRDVCIPARQGDDEPADHLGKP
jgi:putative ABC transport system ATP-binding protein